MSRTSLLDLAARTLLAACLFASALAPSAAVAGDLIAAGAPVPIPDNFGTASQPLIAAVPGGSFVIVWIESDPVDGLFLAGRFYDSQGLPITAPFEIADDTTCSGMGRPLAVEALPDGSFATVWRCSGTVNARIIGSDGLPQTPTILVTDEGVVASGSIRLGAGSSGFFVAWQDSVSILARHFDTTGTPTSAAFEVFDKGFTSTVVSYGMDLVGASDLIASWSEWTGVTNELLAARFSASGALLTAPFAVSGPGVISTGRPTVLAESDGGYSLLWSFLSSGVVGARRFTSADVPIAPGVEIPVPTLSNSGDIVSPVRSSIGYMFLLPYSSTSSTQVLHRLDESFAAVAPAMPVTQEHDFTTPGVAPDANGNPMVLNHYRLLYFANQRDSFQRFCDTDDATCDRCADFDDSLDADADGQPDACDLCTNVGGVQVIENAKLFLTGGGETKLSKFRLRGEVNLPATFAELDPVGDGFRVALLSATFGTVANGRLPQDTDSGVWELKGGKAWKFKGDSAASSSSFRGPWRIQIKDRSKKAPGRVRVSVKHTNGFYRLRLEDLLDVPPKGMFIFGDESVSEGDLCGEVGFLLENCKTNDGTSRSVRCKQ